VVSVFAFPEAIVGIHSKSFSWLVLVSLKTNLNEVIPLCIDSIYSLYYICFIQHNYIIKTWVKATCFDLKSRRHEVLYNVAVRIWDIRWLTVCAVIRTIYIK
jgi:hypothetical protein